MEKDNFRMLFICILLGIIISAMMVLLVVVILAFVFQRWEMLTLFREPALWMRMIVFGTVGGLLGALIIWKEKKPSSKTKNRSLLK